jgi:hypothetical protein
VLLETTLAIKRSTPEEQVQQLMEALKHKHKLEWLYDLGVEYASTFDTDPFEPPPDGVRTIFPFWVPGPGGSGYMELPYTLVEDFNLFVVLRERNIDVWKRKVDWLAERGGMVLVSTHPDYMCTSDVPPAPDEYPAGNYAELLTYIKNTTREPSGMHLPATWPTSTVTRP